MFRLVPLVAAIALAGCQTAQLSEELPKAPVMERVDGRSVSESEILRTAAKSDMAGCVDEVRRADREGKLPITPEQRLAVLKDFSHAKAYELYEQVKVDLYVRCMERRGYQRSGKPASVTL